MADREIERRPDGTFAPGQSGYERHGGEGCVKAIQRGTPLTGLAAVEEAQVKADLDELGRAELVKEAAVRLHTAMRLYWAAVQSAADAGDLKRLDGYCARFGWLASASLRAWAQLKSERPDGANVLDYEQVLAAQRQREAGDE